VNLPTIWGRVQARAYYRQEAVISNIAFDGKVFKEKNDAFL
jgi:hypothetical protein